MKFIKGLLVSITALIVVYVIICFFAPKKLSVEKSIEITASKSQVMEQIANFKNWEKWSPWVEKDSTIKNTFTGEDGTAGSSMSWTSMESGDGNMKITEATEDQMNYDLNFTKPWVSSSKGNFNLSENDGVTTVTWSNNMDFSFIQRGMMLFMGIDKVIGESFERGLKNISNLGYKVESKPIKISEIEYMGNTFLGIRNKTTIKEAMTQEFYATNYGKIAGLFVQNKWKIPAKRVAVFYDWNEVDSTCEVFPAFVVSPETETAAEGFEVVTLEKSKAVVAEYYGDYTGAYQAHIELGEYFKENNLKSGLVIEEYVNDPKEVPVEELLTKIYYLIITE